MRALRAGPNDPSASAGTSGYSWLLRFELLRDVQREPRMNHVHTMQDQWQQPGAALYVQVRALIVQAIRSGEWPAGASIPPEKRLCERFGVSMGTLRKAVDELTSSGILVRRQGRGTFVARHSEGRYLFSFFHLVLPDGRKEYPAVRFKAFETLTADADMASLLKIAQGDGLFHIRNVLSLGGQISSVDDIYLPQALFPDLDEVAIVQRDTTLYQMYQDRFGVSVARTQEEVQACSATVPYTQLLKVKLNTPLLRVVRQALALDNTVVEVRHSHVNTLHCKYCPQADSLNH